MATVEELQTKLERSEAARAKLRVTLNVLKEQALNTGELLKQHQAVKGQLAEASQRAERERAARVEAQGSLAALHREQEGMQSELKRVSAQAARAARAAEEAARAQQAQRGELEALRRHVAGLERQVQSLGQQAQHAAVVAAPTAQPVADSGALRALAAQLEDLQERYGALQSEMHRWRAALGGLAVLASGGSPPAEAQAELPEGAGEASTMLAPLRIPQQQPQQAPAAMHESNQPGDIEEQRAAWRPALGAMSPTRRPLSPGGSRRGARGRQAGGAGRGPASPPAAAAAEAGADGGGEGGGPMGDARQRAVAAYKAGTLAAPDAGSVPPPRRKTPSNRPRSGTAAAAAAERQQVRLAARQAGAAAAQPLCKRVRVEEPPAAVAAPAAERPAPTAQPAAAAATVAQAEPAGEAAEEPGWDVVMGEAGLGAPEGPTDEGAGPPEAAAPFEPSLAVSANGLPGEEPVAADRIKQQLDGLAGSAPSAEAAQSAAAELALMLQEGSPVQALLTGFVNALVMNVAAPPNQQASASPALLETLPTHRWFQAQQAQQQQAQQREEEDLVGTPPAKGEPSAACYAAAWCSADALRCHRLPWLLHCVLRLEAELQQAGLGSCPSGMAAAAAGAEAAAGEPEGLWFSSQLRAYLHRLVVAGCLARVKEPESRACGGSSSPGKGGRDSPPGAEPVCSSPPGAEPTGAEGPEHQPRVPRAEELCVLAAAAAGLCRLLGQQQALCALLGDLLSIRPLQPEEVLPPIAAALELWPDALHALPTPGERCQRADAGEEADGVAALTPPAEEWQLADVHAALQQLCRQPAEVDVEADVQPAAAAEEHSAARLRTQQAARCLGQLGERWWGWAGMAAAAPADAPPPAAAAAAPAPPPDALQPLGGQPAVAEPAAAAAPGPSPEAALQALGEVVVAGGLETEEI